MLYRNVALQELVDNYELELQVLAVQDPAHNVERKVDFRDDFLDREAVAILIIPAHDLLFTQVERQSEHGVTTSLVVRLPKLRKNLDQLFDKLVVLGRLRELLFLLDLLLKPRKL